MMWFDVVILGLIPATIFGLGLVSGWIAWAKHYRPWYWLLSMGPIGTFVIAILPDLLSANTPEERDKLESKVNWTGGILSGMTFLPVVGLPVMGAIVFLSFRAAAPAPMPLIPPPGVTAAQDELTADDASDSSPSVPAQLPEAAASGDQSAGEQPVESPP